MSEWNKMNIDQLEFVKSEEINYHNVKKENNWNTEYKIVLYFPTNLPNHPPNTYVLTC